MNEIITDADWYRNKLSAIHTQIRERGLPQNNFSSLLPLLFNWRSEPFSLNEHRPFEAFHSITIPKVCTLKGARQIAKTTNIAVRVLLLCNVPHKPALRGSVITPLFEQVRRISNDYVAPLLQGSCMSGVWSRHDTEKSVLRRTFQSGALLRFAYAFLSAEGLRGIDNDFFVIDEYQDFRSEHMGVIVPSLSHSKIGSQVHSGTAKGIDTPLNTSWANSSQAEWVVKCLACNHYNIPSLEHDLEKMIGPIRDDISAASPGLVCARCDRPVFADVHGAWVHKHPELAAEYPGFHISQPIMHIHYTNPDKWAEINAARELRPPWTPTRVKNEIYGEEAGSGFQLLTSDDLKAAAVLPYVNNPRNMAAAAAAFPRNKYIGNILAVDWGGGGESGESLTVAAVLGILPSGVIEVYWARRLFDPHNHLAEAREIVQIFKAFRLDQIAHDYTGAGSVKESGLVQSGIGMRQLVPIRYASAPVAPLMVFKKPKPPYGGRPHHVIDKTRSIVHTTTAIQMGKIQFFQYDFKSKEDAGLLSDFLALTDRKVERERGTDLYIIGRITGKSDDFAQAVNIGSCALWHRTKLWPRIDVDTKYNVSKEDAATDEMGWGYGDYTTEA